MRKTCLWDHKSTSSVDTVHKIISKTSDLNKISIPNINFLTFSYLSVKCQLIEWQTHYLLKYQFHQIPWRLPLLHPGLKMFEISTVGFAYVVYPYFVGGCLFVWFLVFELTRGNFDRFGSWNLWYSPVVVPSVPRVKFVFEKTKLRFQTFSWIIISNIANKGEGLSPGSFHLIGGCVNCSW